METTSSPIERPKRFGAYHRISRLNGRDIEAESTMSDKVAFEQMDAWAAMRGHLKPTRYLDTDVSGSKLDRPELDRLMADLKAGTIDGIVVAQVDRLSRADVGDALAVVKQILDIAPSGLVLLDLGIDPSTEFGEFGLTILLGLARMQWRRYQRQWVTARKRAVGRGIQVGPAPFGYLRADDRTFAPDPATDWIVKGAFAAAAAGGAEGLHAAMAYLAEHAPGRRWGTTETRLLLSSRVYLGEISNGDMVNPTAHPALVSLETWMAAQSEPRNRRSNGTYPLRHLATCGACGHGLVGQLQTAKGGYKYRRYRCSNPACNGGSSISAEALETFVRERLVGLLDSKGFRLSFDAHGLTEASEALAQARDDRMRFATNADLLKALGPEAAAAMAQTLSQAVDAAEAHYQHVASQAARSQTLPAVAELDDPGKFRQAVETVTLRLSVARGRGPIDQRVTFLLVGEADDTDNGPGMLAA